MRVWEWLLLLCLAGPTLAQEGAEAVAGEETPPKTEAKEQEAAAATEKKEQDEQEREKQLQWEVDGFWNNLVRYQNASGENKLGWFSHLATDVVHNGKTPFHVRFNGRSVLQTGSDPLDYLYNTYDNFDHALAGRLYEFYVETLSKKMLNVRAGRMFVDEGTWLHFDGLRLDVNLNETVQGLSAYVVGGFPVYWNGDHDSDHWFVGVVAKGQIKSPRTRWRFEYYHVSEYFGGINDPVIDPIAQPVSIPAGTVNDDLLGFTVWHRLPDNQWSFYGRFTLLNGNANELQLRGQWRSQDAKWTVFAEWYQLFERLFNVTNDLTPYVPMMDTFEPFGRITVRATYRVPDWIAQLGSTWRTLLDGGVESIFNHEYISYYLTVTRVGLAQQRLDVSLTAIGYETDGPNDTNAIGGSIDYRLRENIRISSGVDYSLWKYDWYRDTEWEDVWSIWLRVRWQAKKNTLVEGAIMVDDDRFTTYTTLVFKVVLRF